MRVAPLIATAALAILACSVVAPAAFAAPYTISDPSGGDCSAIGTWSLSAHTCTLNTNIVRTSTDDGIVIASDGMPVITTQRMLWKGNFNEVWGQ